MRTGLAKTKRERERRQHAESARRARVAAAIHEAREIETADDRAELAGWRLPGACGACGLPVELRLLPFRWVDANTEDRHRCRIGRAA